MKLVIIGNGFDLHHGLNTSFNSFREYLLDNNKKALVQRVDSIIKSRIMSLNYSDSNLAWNNLECILNKEFSELYGNIEKIESLEDLVEEFTLAFYEYLISEEKNSNVIINKNIESMISNADIFIVFNYTKTYKAYIHNNNADIFHIHGELDNKNPPLIGYHKGEVNSPYKSDSDYYRKYNNNILHKPAIAFKQNLRDLDREIIDFVNKHKGEVNEIIIIGYSFGDSDNHVYKIINDIFIAQKHSRNMHYLEAEALKKIDIYLFSYELSETNELISKIKSKFKNDFKRNMEVRKYGNGITKGIEELIRFHIVEY